MLSKLFPRSTQTPKPTGPTLSINPTEPSPSPSADSDREFFIQASEKFKEIEKAQELLPKLERMLYTKTGTLKKADIEFLISALKKL